MIFDNIKNITRYEQIPGIGAAFTALAQSVASGDFNREVFAKVMTAEYDTSVPDQLYLENHHKFIDLYYMASKKEKVIIESCNDHKLHKAYSPETDVEWFEPSGNFTSLLLSQGDFLMIFPGEAHAANLPVNNTTETVKKIIVKIPAAL